MADLINLRLFDRPHRINNGMRMVMGSASMSASAITFDTSKIEGYFRRCHQIIFDKLYNTSVESAYLATWVRSTAHLNGFGTMIAPASQNNTVSLAVAASGQLTGYDATDNVIVQFTAWGV